MPEGATGAAALGHQAVSLAEAFARDHEGRIAGYGAAAVRDALHQLERVHQAIAAADAFAVLRFDADTEPPEHGALLSEIEELSARVDTLLAFFDLEWIELPDARAAELVAAPELEPYAHALTVLGRSRPHRLSVTEEQVLTEKSMTGADAWRRLFEEQLAAVVPEVDGQPTEVAEVAARLSAEDRGERWAAGAALTASMVPGLRTRVSILNTLVADHAVDDRLRRYPHWMAALNLDTEASDASVRSLVEAVIGRYDIPRRWSILKARALGLQRLHYYDRQAPIGAPPRRFAWAEARDLVIASYAGFSPELGVQAKRFFSDGWIDAVQRPGKRPGAYCAPTLPAANPFILLNFAGRRDDVLTLAHELGHGLHFLLAAPQGILQLEAPETVTETVAVFGETLALTHLLSSETDPQVRLGLLAYQLDEAVGTVFRQITIHRFEDAVHNQRRHGELSADRLGELWMEVNTELYGDALQLPDDFRIWWSTINHVFLMPGYVYAYAYGQLLALSFYARYLDDPEAFVPRFVELLRAGGSRSPVELAALVGADLNDPGLWAAGLELIDRQLAEAEQALATVAR